MTLSLLIIAGLGAVAILVSKVVHRFVPEIVVFLSLGLLIGPQGPFQLINERNIASLDLLTQVALAAVIFLIGDRLRLDQLRDQRQTLVPLNVVQLLASGVLVFFATQWAGADVRIAAVLALIAAESGVLTVTATVKEERSKGPLTDILLSSVGLTNVGVALAFGLAFPFILASSGEASSILETARVFAQLVVLSTVIGFAGGWLLGLFSRAMETSGELLLLLLVVITGLAGAAVAVDGSVVVSALIAGLYISNSRPWLADRLFAAVRTLEAPIYLVFFVVAGASIHLDELVGVGAVGGAYLVARLVGKVGGSAAGGFASRHEGGAKLGLRTGLGLLPHAGMAIALVALVAEQAPVLGESVSAVVLGSIVVFELAGPLLTRRALRSADETGKAKGEGGIEMIPEVGSSRTFERVLVPVGSVDVIVPRLPFLFDMIGTMRAELVAVHISRPGSGAAEEDEPAVLRLVREVAEERNISCQTIHRVSEQIASVLVDTVRTADVDLVIMGEPARTSLLEPSRWGMVSQRVIRDVSVPVLVYPVDPGAPERVPSAYLRKAIAADDAMVAGAQDAVARKAGAVTDDTDDTGDTDGESAKETATGGQH